MSRHLVLVGLPGAGKTTVGRLVAAELGAPLIDIDAVIVRKAQKPVARIFAEHGEQHFRQLETEAMRSALAGTPAVITPGGGWAAQPGALESARVAAFLVYLKTMALTAAKRTGTDGVRPLMTGGDPVGRMRELLKEREPFYAQADAEVKADTKTPAQLAQEIVTLARERAGW